VRLAGSARLPDGSRLAWTVADGTRGRRWRSVTTSPDGRLVLATLLEVEPDGVPAKLELASPDGLLTLHPEADGRSLHGNVVRAGGVEHVALPWSERHLLVAGGSPVTAAVAARRLAGVIGVGEGWTVPAVEVQPELRVREATWRVARVAERRWHLVAADGGALITVDLDPLGIPVRLADEARWPLEVASPG
jgi:hypothetical protein